MPTRSFKNKSSRITAHQVAERAGVSSSAVSRAFTDGASIAPQTLLKVMKAAKALGYQPNFLARSLMTGRTELIGLVSNNFDNPAFMEIFDRFTRTLQDQGLRPLLANLSGSSDPDRALAMLRQYSVDGVIVASSTVADAFIQKCATANIPLVHAFGKRIQGAKTHIVAADNVQGGRLAAQVLLNHGYRNIAFLGGPRTSSSSIDRLHGFRSMLAEAGLDLRAAVFANGYAQDEGRAMMASLLSNGSIDAVFCGDDILAIGALDACKQAAVSVPDAMGILGFNDIAMAAWATFDLSTIRQPIADIIVAAVELSINLVKSDALPPQEILFHCTPVLRSTLRQR
jgi:DNA-binding LacI/PurR family transcriptional regulator